MSLCPSDPRNPLTPPWQVGRDNGTDHNGTFSRPPKDLEEFLRRALALAKRRRLWDYDTAKLTVACNNPTLYVQGCRGCVANTA